MTHYTMTLVFLVLLTILVYGLHCALREIAELNKQIEELRRRRAKKDLQNRKF